MCEPRPEIIVRRMREKKDATAGVLEVYPEPYNHGGDPIFTCQTLELTWKNNRKCVSRIPMGDYPLIKRTAGKYFDAYKKRWGHKFSIHVSDVKGRAYILIHSGNDHSHTKGCILVGESIRETKTGFWLSDSRRAYNRLYVAVRGLSGITVKTRDCFDHGLTEEITGTDLDLVKGDRTEL